MDDSMRIFEIISRKAGALPALGNSTEFAFTAKGIIYLSPLRASSYEPGQLGWLGFRDFASLLFPSLKDFDVFI